MNPNVYNPNVYNQNLPFLKELKATRSKVNALLLIIFLTILFIIIGILIYFFIIKDEPLSPLVLTPEPTSLSSEFVDSNDVSSSSATNTPTPTNSSFTPTPTNSSFTPTNSSFTPTPTDSSFTPTPTNNTFTPTPTDSSFTPTPTNITFTPLPTNITFTPTPTNITFTPTPTNNNNLCSDGGEYCFKNLVIEIDNDDLVYTPTLIDPNNNGRLNYNLKITINRNNDYVLQSNQIEFSEEVDKWVFRLNTLSSESQEQLNENLNSFNLSSAEFEIVDDNGNIDTNVYLSHSFKVYLATDPDTNYAEHSIYPTA